MPILKKLSLAVFILMLLLLTACSKNVVLYRQALNDYKHGEFESSLNNSVNSLQLKPTYVKAQDLTKKTYEKAIAGRDLRIQNIMETAQPDMWDYLVDEYFALVEIQKLIIPVNPLYNPKTGVSYYFDLKDYETKLSESRTGAADYHYNRGLYLAESSEDPEIQREAALEFKTAISFVPNYEDAAQRYDDSRRLAIKRIAVLAFEDKSGARRRYGSLIDLLTESIISKLVQDKQIEEFMEIVTRDQMAALLQEQQYQPPILTDAVSAAQYGNVLGAHEILTGKLIQINYTAPRISSIEIQETKNIVTGKEKYIDENGKEKTRDIKADVTCVYKKYTKSTSVKIISSYSLIEVVTGKVKLQGTVNSEAPWSDYWYRVVSGDDRVLSEEQKALMSKEEPYPPTELDMVNEAINLLSDDIVDKIRHYVQ